MEHEVAIPLARNLAADVPWVVQVVVGVMGLVVLAWGARIYKTAVYLTAFGVGAIGATAVLDALSAGVPDLARPEVMIIGALVGGGVVVGLAGLAHRLALVGAGALGGVALAGAVGGLLPAFPWWGVLIGALVGAVALPLLFPVLLKLATPLAGAVMLAWAVGRVDSLWVIGGLWALGALFQLGFVRVPEDDGDEDDE